MSILDNFKLFATRMPTDSGDDCELLTPGPDELAERPRQLVFTAAETVQFVTQRGETRTLAVPAGLVLNVRIDRLLQGNGVIAVY